MKGHKDNHYDRQIEEQIDKNGSQAQEPGADW
jgi:hypothetical protein